jgi:4-hydroxy-2-oxoheptanedioate aldolase
MRGYAGLDLIVLDLEHGPNNVFSLQNLIRAAQVSGPLPVVRVRVDSPSLIGEVLDVGLFTGKCREIAASLTQ